ncbi:MAG: hypothetical protein HY717_11480 [Planctomycetes bacterium]|nr:hypothetical protein [Planctomycetota bacterium]
MNKLPPFQAWILLRRLLACSLLTWPGFGGLAPASAQEQKPPSVQNGDKKAVKKKRFRDPIEFAQQMEKRFRAEVSRFEIDRRTRRWVLLFWGSARGAWSWKGEGARVFADALVVLGEVSEGGEAGGGAGAGEEGSKKTAPKEKPLAEDLGLGKEARIEPVSFYAEGNVRIESADVILETDAFFYDHEDERGVAVRARGHGRLEAVKKLAKVLQAREFAFLDQEASPLEPHPTIGPAPAAEESPWLPTPLEEEPEEAEPAEPPVSPPAGTVPRAEPPRAATRRKAIQMAFRAEILRLANLRRYEGEGLVISTCEYGVPHFALESEAVKITPVEPKPEPRHFLIDPEDTWLTLQDVPVLPLPLGEWNTEWLDYNPIRGLNFSRSGKHGYRADVAWNLNWLLRQAPGAGWKPVKAFLEDSRLDARTEYMSRRGFGYGVQGEYGKDPIRWLPWELSLEEWRYHGESIYYRIDDRGRDVTAPPGAPEPDNPRWWGSLVHRQQVPYLGTVDVEFSEQSDENFLREFFPFTRTEKEQESLVYFRRSFQDNLAVTGLYKYRSNSFETAAERLPEGKFFLMEQPVLLMEHSAFRSGLYTTLDLQAANLRLRPADDLDLPSQRFGRYDLLNEWSCPVAFQRYATLRPFAGVRASLYEAGIGGGGESLDGHGLDHDVLDREAFSAGIRASQEWSRVYRLPAGGFMERWFDIAALKHVLIPSAGYSNLFSNNLDPDRLAQIDEVDRVRELESVDLSLRNLLWARGPAGLKKIERGQRREKSGELPAREALELQPSISRVLLDAEASLSWLPRRDENGGDRFSLLDLDATFLPLPYLALRSRNFLDPNDRFDYELADNSLTLMPEPDLLRFTVGERFRRGLSQFIYFRAGINFSRRYMLEAFYGFDLESFQRNDVEVKLVRFFHRFAVELDYSFDAGERKNHTVSVNFYPVELFTGFWEERREREFRGAGTIR